MRITTEPNALLSCSLLALVLVLGLATGCSDWERDNDCDPLDHDPPSRPAGLQVSYASCSAGSSDTTRVELSWSIADERTGTAPRIASPAGCGRGMTYHVGRRVKTDVEWTIVTPVHGIEEVEWTDHVLVDVQRALLYSVRAEDECGASSDWSDTVEAYINE